MLLDASVLVESVEQLKSESFAKETIRNAIYAKAGDDRSILGLTNDMTQWLFLSLVTVLEAINGANDLDDIKKATNSLLSELADSPKIESTVELKSAKKIIERFEQTNHAICLALKEQYQIKEKQNA